MNSTALAIMASALVMASCSKGQEAVSEFGIQLYSVRELLGDAEKYAANHEQVLADLASMGYSSVEAASFSDGKFYGVTPEEFKADCDAAGLKVVSSHTMKRLSPEELASGDFTASLGWWDMAIPAHKAAGVSYIVCPWLGVPETLADLDVYCQYLNEIGRKCKEAGIQFGYHNHSHEFKEVEGVKMYDYLIAHTDPELVFFQMDVYWTVRGGNSPVKYFKENPGIFKVLHIKDDCELGESGMVGFDAIFRNVGTAGTVDYIVEIEHSGIGDIMESCRVSADYLKNNFAF